MDGENLTTSLLHWGAYSSIRRPWSSNLETFLHLLSISDKRNHRWLFLLLVLYCLLSVQFISGTQSCLTLCKTHGLQATGCQASLFITNSQSLLKLMSIGQWCHPTISPSVISFSSCLQSFPASGAFSMNQFCASGGESLQLQLQLQSLPWIFRTDFL